jgi:TonB-dependent receptor-like protein/carboxypeptidase family protein
MGSILVLWFLLGHVSGVVVDQNEAVLSGITVTAHSETAERRTVTDEAGRFSLDIPGETLVVSIEGPFIQPLQETLPAGNLDNIRIQAAYRIPPVHQDIVVTASPLETQVQTYTDEIYKRALFSRDDQLLETLNAGINAGQHEGGGKSLEIRRFGFNLDHGGVNGGLKVLVDDVQQNQSTQGHGQGYLGALKTLTPELIQDVNILNGPFSAEYGDFSGLGVVHIRLKESLADPMILRLQRGSFGSYRTFFGYSPSINEADAFLAYEGSRTSGPFLNPLRYRRDNVTANYTRRLEGDAAIGLKLNFGRNDFFSSGQIPLDLVASGQLARFGFIDPSDGGRVRLGTAGVYYRKTFQSGASFKADGFLGRSLFDLYSNFTLFLNDTSKGDGIQQHDSRFQQGFNTQYVRPHRLWGNPSLLTVGTNFHDNQINVGLFPQAQREPLGVTNHALAHVTNMAGYAQQATDFLHGKLHLEAGLRWDYFRFFVNDRVEPAQRFQPKFGAAYRFSPSLPLTLNFNYGRGINTQDARGVVQRPASPRIATTDFYELGTVYASGRLSATVDTFLIDRSNEQVYIPDDGTFELKGPSRSYGYEGKTSIRLTRFLSFNAAVTQVTNSFYRTTFPRMYVDSAPHTVANSGLTLSGWHDIYASLRYRHVGNYRLDGQDASIRASGLDVLDLAVTKTLRRGLDFNVDVDNLTNKTYYETQNFFESRSTPTMPAIARIHGTPGYPIGITVGLTFHFGEKNR